MMSQRFWGFALAREALPHGLGWHSYMPVEACPYLGAPDALLLHCESMICHGSHVSQLLPVVSPLRAWKKVAHSAGHAAIAHKGSKLGLSAATEDADST
eukprot:4329712-Amphidinium_carterae.1